MTTQFQENLPLPNSLDTSPVLNVDHEITSEYILTNLAIALGVGTQDVAAAVALLKTGGVKFQMPQGIMRIENSHYLAIQPLISLPTSLSGFEAILSRLKMFFELGVGGPITFNSLFFPIPMNTETLSAYKPVTLTLTGKLKPSTLTKVPRKKSSPSSKPKPMAPSVWQAFHQYHTTQGW